MNWITSLSSGEQTPKEHTENERPTGLRDTETTTHSNGSNLSKSDIFELLKNSRRRSVIRYLREHDGSAVLSDVAEHIAAEENDVTVRELSSDQRKRVYIGLYQCHLPKMDSWGLVEYDKNRGTIELQDSVAQLSRYLDTPESTAEDDIDRNRAELVVAACIVGLVSLGTLGVGGLSVVPAAGWTFVSIVGIIVIVGLQYRNRGR